MTLTLNCPACGARWHTAARRGRSEATETCLRCGGPLSEEPDPMTAVEGFCDSWRRWDVDAVVERSHPDVEIAEIGDLLPGRESSFEGHEGVRRWMELIQELWDVEFRRKPLKRRVVDSSSVEMVAEVEARSSGQLADYSATARSLWDVEDGLVRRVEVSVAREAAPDAPRA